MVGQVPFCSTNSLQRSKYTTILTYGSVDCFACCVIRVRHFNRSCKLLFILKLSSTGQRTIPNTPPKLTRQSVTSCVGGNRSAGAELRGVVPRLDRMVAWQEMCIHGGPRLKDYLRSSTDFGVFRSFINQQSKQSKGSTIMTRSSTLTRRIYQQRELQERSTITR